MRVKVGGEGIPEGGAESRDRDEGVGVVGRCGVEGEEDQDLTSKRISTCETAQAKMMARNLPNIRISSS